MKHRVDMLSGSITKGLLTMIMPIMVMNVMQSVFGIIDMIVLKNFADDSAVGAVGAAGPMITLCTSVVIGIAVGANITVAKRIGMGDRERVDNAVATALSVAVISGVLLAVAGVVFSRALLVANNCPEELLEQAVLYFRIYFYGIPLAMFYNFCAAILRATGDTRTPMFLLILGGVIKVAFNVIFASVFRLGVAGVAIATAISNLVIAALAFVAVLKRDEFSVDFRKMRFFSSELSEMLYVGILSGLQSATASFANVIIMSAVNKFGADATTGVSIANQFDGLMYQVIYAPSLAAAPYIAQNIGAGMLDRMKKAVVSSILITTAFGAVLGSLSAIFSGQLSSLMSASPAVIAYSQQKMVIISSTYFICGIYEILSGVLRGMKRPVIPTAASFVFMFLLRFFWVYVVFPHFRHLTFLYLVWPIGWILSSVTLVITYFIVLPRVRAEVLAARAG